MHDAVHKNWRSQEATVTKRTTHDLVARTTARRMRCARKIEFTAVTFVHSTYHTCGRRTDDCADFKAIE